MDSLSAARRIAESFLILTGVGRRVLRDRGNSVFLGMDTAGNTPAGVDPVEEWRCLSASVAQALDGIIEAIAGNQVESVYVIHLDADFELISSEFHAIGNANSVQICSREIIEHAHAAGASNFILVHNHPSGGALPSRADVTQTHRVARAALSCDLRLVDHIICAPGEVRSLMSDRSAFVLPPGTERMTVADFSRAQLRLSRHIASLPRVVAEALRHENWQVAVTLYSEGRPLSVARLANMLGSPLSLVMRRIIQLARAEIVAQRLPQKENGPIFLELTPYGTETIEWLTRSAFSTSHDATFFR